MTIKTPSVSKSLYPEREARKKQIIRLFEESCYFDVTGALLNWYYVEHDIQPQGEARERVHARIMDVVAVLEYDLVQAEYDTEMTTLTAWLEVSADGLQDSVTETILSALSEKE